MFKRGSDPVKMLLVGGLVYMMYSYWYLSTYNMMYINKIVDLERKIRQVIKAANCLRLSKIVIKDCCG